MASPRRLTRTSIIDPDLEHKLRYGEKANAVISMIKDTQDVVQRVEAQKIPDAHRKSKAITDEVEKFAKESQKQITDFLDKNKINYHSVWITNEIFLYDVNLDTLNRIAGLGGIRNIREEVLPDNNKEDGPQNPPRGSK